ncbi:putative transporter [Colletotrichum siamense]|uniref:Transporter n=1 Tax=Colletotrichum siamense TaxID=690259 RepID=A0A9P5BR28_COLSI|nr:putative transporter [Colletotrichum siamense]KAF4848895.1 putative transporter [Colletotrichum siamense]
MSIKKAKSGIKPCQKEPTAGSVHDIKVANDLDDQAAIFLREHEVEWANYEASEAKRVLRKIDWRLMPLIVGTTIIAAVDKILISNAALYGMNEDTHLVGQQYSWVGSIFYFGWLIAEYPANAVLQKLPVGKTVGTAVVAWGGCVMCLAAAQNAAGLMVLRFLMGVLESPLFPAVTILNTMWYKKSEQPVRMAITFTGFSSLVTGVVSYGIGHAKTGIASWRLLFLVIGGFTVFWGAILLVWLPDSPLADNFLTGKDKYIALDRVKDNMTELPHDNKVGRLMAYYFFYFFWGPYATALSLPMANVSGHTKKLTINATVFLAYCIANIVGPQIFIEREAPNYTTGYSAIMAFEVVAIACMVAYAVGCMIENRIRDRKEGTEVDVTVVDRLGDLTDYEKRGFRYVY